MKRLLSLLSLLALLGACGEQQATAPAATSRLAIAVAALELPGVGDADYTLQIYNGDPSDGATELVAEAAHLASSRYGDGAGALAYVAPCDASTGTNHVRLILESLSDAGGTPIDPATYLNPTPVTKAAPCVANADTPVNFNLTVMRQANQGFFDVAVSFTNIFCSAKFDCVDENDAPLVLLHGPDGDRAATMVMAFACTSGMGSTTWLHFSDAQVVCGLGDTTTAYVSPAGPDGNQGPLAPLFFQRALYVGDEQLTGYDKCYWNQAFGLEDPAPLNCRLIADATASVGSWAAAAGRSPADTVYPYIHFEVPFTDAEGKLACGRHALNGGDLRVTTRYTDFIGATFAYERRCGDGAEEPHPIVEVPHVTCGADVVGTGSSDSVLFDSASGVSVAINGDRSPSYALPDGLTLGTCCLNPCCTQ